MVKIINLYKITFLLDLIFFLLGSWAFIFYRPNNDFGDYFLFTFIIISCLVSILIGLKLVIATEKKIKIISEYIIVGYIATVIKILSIALLIIGELYFFKTTIHTVYSFDNKNFTFYLIILAFLAWNIFSVFNCVVYFFMAKMNKNIRFKEIENIGK